MQRFGVKVQILRGLPKFFDNFTEGSGDMVAKRSRKPWAVGQPSSGVRILTLPPIYGRAGIGEPNCLLNSPRESACGFDSRSYRQVFGCVVQRLRQEAVNLPLHRGFEGSSPSVSTRLLACSRMAYAARSKRVSSVGSNPTRPTMQGRPDGDGSSFQHCD